jgi:RNA-directed DNA polymerase
VEHFLSERGLRLSHEKTSITRVEDGFDFLGQRLRRHPSGKVLLRPSRRNVKTFLTEVRRLIREEGRSLTAGELIQALTPKVRGWALYHRHASSKRTYAYVDQQIHRALWRWARRRHRGRSAHWVKRRYYRERGCSWMFTGELLTRRGEPYTVTLLKAADVRIERHEMIRRAANPYDPAWEPYYEGRLQAQMQLRLEGREVLRALYERQNGRCQRCSELFTDPSDWQVHHRHWRVYGGDESLSNLELLHANCHRQLHRQEVGNEGGCGPRGPFAKA